MENRVWSKSEEKWAYILVLRGQEVSHLRVSGNVFTLKNNVQRVQDALDEGQDPANVGAKVVEKLDARTISKAEVSEGNISLTLHGGTNGSQELSFTTADNDADAILQAILAQSGRTFQSTEEEIGVVEALLPPAVVGVVGGLLWMLVYNAASTMAGGEDVAVKGFRHRGLKRLLIWVAELLGTGGTVAAGVVLLAIVVGWAAIRIVRRPKRTVWLPQ